MLRFGSRPSCAVCFVLACAGSMERTAGMIFGKISEREESCETPEGEDEGGLVTVTEALDAMAIGPFHVRHLLRMIFFWAVLSMTQECTPYLFPGLRKFLHADDWAIASFAAAFPLGCVPAIS